MKMNKSFKIENFWIVIVWTIIFMLVLAWDQEKIVVLNLILFCYFLYYLVCDSISAALNQRRQVLLESLLIDITTQLKILNNLVSEAKLVISGYSTVILAFLKKLLITITSSFLLVGGTLEGNFGINFDFISQSLQLVQEELNSKDLMQNTLVSSQIVLEISPTLHEGEVAVD